MANIGKIISARGPVIDIAFDSEDKLPEKKKWTGKYQVHIRARI